MSTFTPTREQNRAIQSATSLTNVNVPTAIAGPAGSGKTLVATEIAIRFASQGTIGFSDRDKQQSIYFVTYTRQLKNFVEDQLEQIFGPDQNVVKVLTVHTYLKTFLLENDFEDFYFQSTSTTRKKEVKRREEFFQDFVETSIDNLGLTGCLADAHFLDEEIGWLLGQGIRSPQKYRSLRRTGRRTGLTAQQREKVFQAYRGYMTYLSDEGERVKKKLIDFDDIGNYVLHYCEQHNCTPIASHLIVDEVQDLAKTWVDALRKTTGGKIVYAGDPSQSIYGRGFTWQDITGQRVRPIHLTEDFRVTQEIYLAARSLMEFDREPEGEIAQANQRRRNGDKPKLIFCRDRDSQAQRILDLVAKLRNSNSACTIAVAAPRRECLNELRSRCQGALITTLHSLKGLEADHVILASLDEDVFDFTNEYTQEETNRHLLYVGMTRAKQSLTMMVSSDRPAPVLVELSADYVDLDDSENQAAHRVLLEARASRAQKSREDFELIVKEKVEKEEAVEQVANELQEASTEVVSASDVALIAKLEKELKKLQEQQKKSEEKLQRQEDELRVYRARERSDSAAAAGVEGPEMRRPQFADNAVILILGGLGVKPKDISGIFKHEGLPNNAFEHLDYDEVHSGKFDALELLDTIKYSDVFVSTVPHKIKGIGGSSSLVEFLEENKSSLPKVTFFKSSDGTLKKASKTDLKEALHKSALYAAKKGI